ncbi:MAG TPA: M28 family metallopeptidase [Oligoflexus sp.]|uniref:M28 family metallopeptidase n=1 Tax=Oligoflexus sp. TaxID=1971216 RepID=UPI002D358EA3|nr:M28 family metallopeptidase [Oligoflexus sp.]HYX31506.1 M28 family metallopeptidase [Oligoflexus sp.]
MIRGQILLLAVFMSGAFCKSQVEPGKSLMPWDEKRVRSAVAILTTESHTMGSPRQAQLADWLQKETEAMGLTASVDTFPVSVPDPAFLGGTSGSVMQKLTIDLTARNVYAKYKVPNASCVVLVASHYDTKRLDAGPYLGANDSASSSAALLEIMRQLKERADLKCSVMAVWFDGEEAWLPEWRDGEERHPARQQDNLYGSRHLAEQLETCASAQCLPKHLGGEQVKALVLLDMIGMPGVRLALDSLSDPKLMTMAVNLDKELFQGDLYGRSYSRNSVDDHVPFLQKGVPAIDLIDFDNLQTWHQPSDLPETLDYNSIEKVSQLAMAMVLKLAQP